MNDIDAMQCGVVLDRLHCPAAARPLSDGEDVDDFLREPSEVLVLQTARTAGAPS